MTGTLYLIPSALGDAEPEASIPAQNLETTRKISCFIVENVRSARRFLKKIHPDISIDDLNFMELNEHTPDEDLTGLLEPMLAGKDAGLLSEAGLPCIADPGAKLVAIAHEKKIKIVPLSGPSSIFLALMASGFNGQNFVFHGYLPIDKRERARSIKALEQQAHLLNQTQVFIEAPYRNLQLFEALLHTCQRDTLICLAVNLTMPGEWIKVLNTEQWKREHLPDIHKKPAVFLVYR